MERKRRPPAPASSLPAAIYARISRDREGAGLGVERQEADCRALAERLGWQVVAVYVDNDISAYSGARRPQYEEMLKAVRNGEVKGIVSWHTDRLHRRLAELEAFVSLVETHDVQIQTVKAGEMDLTTATGRMVARTLGNLAHYEVDHARERMKSAKDQMASAGKYRGGPRPFGFDKDGITVRPDEAEIIRAATEGILAGRALAAVARDLNDKGWTTSTDKLWTYQRLRDVLVRPRNAGLISTGRPDRDDFEVIGKAEWDAIVDEDSWRAVHALLSDPSRRKQQGNDPRWLGSGIYTCGVPTGDGVVCGTSLRAAPYGGTARTTNRTRRYLYRCTAAAHLTISTDKTDEFVKGVVAALVRDPRVVAAMHPRDDSLRADRELRNAMASRLDSFESDYAAGRINGTQLHKATAEVTARLEEVDARLASGLQRSAASPIMRASDPGAAFLRAPVDVQRAVLRSVLQVEVRPAARRGAAWSDQRLALTPVA
jgi:site-specific DNA recombinase